MENNRFELVDRAAAVEAIRRMNEEDLHFLNRLIVDRLKLSAKPAVRPCCPISVSATE